jgi:hypothetical protein
MNNTLFSAWINICRYHYISHTLSCRLFSYPSPASKCMKFSASSKFIRHNHHPSPETTYLRWREWKKKHIKHQNPYCHIWTSDNWLPYLEVSHVFILLLLFSTDYLLRNSTQKFTGHRAYILTAIFSVLPYPNSTCQSKQWYLLPFKNTTCIINNYH